MELLNDVREQLSAFKSSCGTSSSFIKREKECPPLFATSEASKRKNRALNRCCRGYLYDHTRIILSRGKCDYIHASLVSAAVDRNYILTQAPLERTVSHFWAMVWEQKSQLIVMLNNLIENGKTRCFSYWPSNTDEVLYFNEVQLAVQMMDEIIAKTNNYVIRRFQLTDKVTNEVRTVQQFHYTAWPDCRAPTKSSDFLVFLQDVRQKGGLVNAGTSSVGPAVIHCYAGIGRSGSFCLIDAALYLLERGQKVNVEELLLQIRRCRKNLVQNEEQMYFCYLSIIKVAKSLDIFGVKETQSNDTLIALSQSNRKRPRDEDSDLLHASKK